MSQPDLPSDPTGVDDGFAEWVALNRAATPPPAWPTSPPASRGQRWPGTRAAWTVGHAIAVLGGVGLTLVGRIDPVVAMVAVVAGVISVAPRLVEISARFRGGGNGTASVAAALRGESQAETRARTLWLLSAVGLGLLTITAMVAAVYTQSLYADSSTPFWRHAPIRWAVLAGALVGLFGLAMVRTRRLGRDASVARELESELELEDAAEGEFVPSKLTTVASLAVLAFAASAGGLTWHVAQPENMDDSPGTILIVGPHADEDARWMRQTFDLNVRGSSLDEAWDKARETFKGETGQLETLLHQADLDGVGFVLVDLEAFDPEPEKHSDLIVARSVGSNPRYLSIATGDVTTIEYASAWGALGRTRSKWRPLGRHPAALGGGEPTLHGGAARRLAAARAFFGQPAFHFPDFDHPNQTPEFNGRSNTLLRGVLYFNLDPNVWSRAVGQQIQIEAAVQDGEIPPSLLK